MSSTQHVLLPSLVSPPEPTEFSTNYSESGRFAGSADEMRSKMLPSQEHSIPTRFKIEAVSNILSYLLLAGALAVVIYSIRCVMLAYCPLPWTDQWRFLSHVVDRQGHLSSGFLWQPHNEHRIPLPKIFDLLDLYVFKGRNIFLIVCVFLVQLSTVAFLAVTFVRVGKLSAVVLRTSIAASVTAHFLMKQSENFWFAWNIAMILPFLGAVAAFLGVSLLSIGARKGNSNLIGPLLLLWAGGMVAAFSLAYGLLLWPLLVMTMICSRIPRKVTVSTFCVGAALTATWFLGYQSDVPPDPVVRHVPGASEMFRFFLLLFASSWSYLSVPLGNALAALAIPISLGAYAWKVIIRQGRDVFATFLLSTMIYVITCAVLITVGRAKYGVQYASTERYQTGILLFWCCLFVLLLYLFANAQPRLIALVFCQIALALVLYFYFKITPAISGGANFHRNMIRATEVAIEMGVNDAPAINYVVIPPLHSNDILSLAQFLHSHHWSIFAGSQSIAYRRQFSLVYKAVQENSCVGLVDGSSRIRDRRWPGIKLWGWAFDTAAKRPARMMAIVDLQGRIVGMGRTGFQRVDVSAAIPAITSNETGYIAYVPGDLERPQLRTYAILADGVSACPLGGTEPISVQLDQGKKTSVKRQ